MARRGTLPALLFPVLAACASVQDDVSKQILRPPPGWLAEPSAVGLAAEPFTIELHDEASLTGFFVPHADAKGRTVVLFHDEQTNVSVLHPYYAFLHEQGFQVLVFDPRGFGKSKGVPTLQAWVYDVPQLLQWLRARPDVDPQQLAFFGTGWGAVTALWAARTQGPCKALVLESLTSPRELVREANGDDGSVLSALSIGMREFAGMPEDIEPVDGAGRTTAPALFLQGELENLRDRKAQLATFSAYAGDKRLWVLPATRSAPHAMLTHDGEYQQQIGAFLRTAFAGTPPGATAAATKTSNASDGTAWYELQITAPATTERRPVEASAVLADGSVAFARTWLENGHGRVRLKLSSAPAAVGAIVVAGGVSEGPEHVFSCVPTDLARSAAAIEPLLLRIESLRNGASPAAECAKLATDLRAAEKSAPFHPRLCAELADVWALLGKSLVQRPEEARRREGQQLLERAIASVPLQPALHVWPGATTTYGYPQERQDVVDEARRLLAAPPK